MMSLLSVSLQLTTPAAQNGARLAGRSWGDYRPSTPVAAPAPSRGDRTTARHRVIPRSGHGAGTKAARIPTSGETLGDGTDRVARVLRPAPAGDARGAGCP